MKKVFYVTLATVCLISCGGKKESSNEAIVLTPETSHIKGDLCDYFSVVDKEYTVTKDQYGGSMVAIEICRDGGSDYTFPKGVKPYGFHGQSITGNAGFGIEILDENGNVIKKSSPTTGGLGGMYSHDDMIEALKLDFLETCIVRWQFDFASDEKPTQFRLTSAYDEEVGSGYDSSDDEEDTENDDEDIENDDDTASASEDWDAVLDSYDSYVTKYISVLKKANNGDLEALADYPALLEEAQELGDKLESAKGEMSSSQCARYVKITNKMTNVATQM